LCAREDDAREANREKDGQQQKSVKPTPIGIRPVPDRQRGGRPLRTAQA
jgi:hypothetical protein